jgi:hypothetical protein
MNRISRIAWFAVLMSLLTGCTYQRQAKPLPPGLPEQIYVSPQFDDYSQERVGVFTFSELSYAPGMGRAAAESIYRELLRKRVFSNVTDEAAFSNTYAVSIIDLARSKGYDIAITVELLYYFDGSAFQPSRVAERIKVVHVPTKEILWYAATTEVSTPAPDTDYIFLTGMGYSALPTTLLLQRNAEKLSNMLLEKSQNLSDI